MTSKIEGLQVVFSEDYQISDSNYKILSDILLNEKVSDELAFDNGLVQTIKILYENGKELPVSLNWLRQKWSENYVSFNFLSMLVPMVREGMFKLQKMKEKQFFQKVNTPKGVEDIPGEPFYVIVKGLDKFNYIFGRFYSVLRASKRNNTPIRESKDFEPPKSVSGIIDKLNVLLRKLSMKADLESYLNINNTDEMNVMVSNTSEYKSSDAQLQKMADKMLRRGGYISSCEVYKESKSELYLNIVLNREKRYNTVAKSIFDFLYELEVNHVSEE